MMLLAIAIFVLAAVQAINFVVALMLEIRFRSACAAMAERLRRDNET
jgi:hypothetical protein